MPKFALTIWLNNLDNIEPDQSPEQRILLAAKKIFVVQGMAGARMQDIANEAGINKAMLHYYFRSKEKLFAVILKEAIGRLIPRVSEIFQGDEPLFVKIELFCDQYISTIQENPYIPLFIINELNRQPEKFIENIWPGLDQGALRKLTAQINDETNAGRIRPIEPFQLVVNMLALCIFPFIGKPILQHFSGMNDEEFNRMLEGRKRDAAEFIINSIRI